MFGLKIKSVKARLLWDLIPGLVIALVIVGVVIGMIAQLRSYESTMNYSEGITDAANIAVEEWLDGVINQLNMFSNSPDIKRMDEERYVSFMAGMAEGSSDLFESLFISTLEGNAITHKGMDLDISSRKYFKDLLSSKKIQISNALSSIVSGKPIVVIILPVYDMDQNFIGAFGASVLLDELAEKMNDIKVGEAGAIFLVDGNGETITHPNPDMIMKFNVVEADQNGYEGLSAAARQMIKGESGHAEFTRPDGASNLLIYRMINGTPNWSIGAIIPATQVDALSNTLLLVILIGFVIIAVIVFFVVILAGRRFSNPLRELSLILNRFADYDLKFDENSKAVKYLKQEDEVGQMTNALAKMQMNLTQLVKKLSEQSIEITESATDLSSVSQEQLASSEELSSQAQTVDENIQNTSASIEEVTSGVEEVAASAQDVSKNSQELSNEINETEQAVKNGQKELALQGGRMQTVDTQNKAATELVTVVAEKANNVQEIVNTIASIAEQTNLLALNAAIEAARAGEAGKGFAVVADEIRKLAEESKTASSNIANILNEIDEGASSANDAVKKTVDLYRELSEGTRIVTSEFDKISDYMVSVNSRVESLMGAAQEQSASAEEMASAMDNSARLTSEIADQISQMNSAVEQQTQGAAQVSSSAEKLNTLAEALDEEVKKFQL